MIRDDANGAWEFKPRGAEGLLAFACQLCVLWVGMVNY